MDIQTIQSMTQEWWGGFTAGACTTVFIWACAMIIALTSEPGGERAKVGKK